MTDIRTRLADALQHELDEHGYEDDDEKRGQVAHHFADVVMSLPGIAIIELPEPDDDHVDGIALFWWQSGDVGASDSMVITRLDPGNESIWYAPTVARGIAAALLAAADAADGSGVPE